MLLREIQDEILRLKQEKDIAILAHSYQSHEITEVADFVGDSYALAKKAMTLTQKTVILCGVRFMAETVKILSPEKTVYLANSSAGCPMAEQFNKTDIENLRAKHPDYTVVAYINTTAELKTVCDVCVTSSCAEQVIRSMPQDKIIFVPDINLGTYCKNLVPEKDFILLDGGCPIHASMTENDVFKVKKQYPSAVFLAHPECKAEVTKQADYTGSTTGIMEYAIKSDKKEFIIGAENSIVEHLKYKCPDKKFFPLSNNFICGDMAITSVFDILDCINGKGEEIKIDEDTRIAAKKCIDKMIEYGG